MKRVIAILGSLMIVVGLKAQKDPTIKKETTPKETAKDSLKTKSSLTENKSFHIKKLPAGAKTLPSKEKPAPKIKKVEGTGSR